MKWPRWLAGVVVLVSAGMFMPVMAGGDKAGTQTEKQFVKDKIKVSYLLYLPEEYGKDAGKQWPVLMFLHGSGESGVDELSKVRKHGPPKICEAKKLPFIVVSPQSPGMGWPVDNLNMLLDDILAKYKCDQDRVYLTGLSMGGNGTWKFAMEHPERFAAIAPMATGADAKQVDKVKNLPVWAFYGAKDKDAGLKGSTDMINAIKAAGGEAKLTVYPDAGHDCWTVSYDNLELYTWLLQHKRPAKK